MYVNLQIFFLIAYSFDYIYKTTRPKKILPYLYCYFSPYTKNADCLSQSAFFYSILLSITRNFALLLYTFRFFNFCTYFCLRVHFRIHFYLFHFCFSNRFFGFRFRHHIFFFIVKNLIFRYNFFC